MKHHYKDWRMKLFPKHNVAFTFRQNIYYRYSREYFVEKYGEEGLARLQGHEGVHGKQYARMGTIKFLMKYFYYNIRLGYKDNPLEIEARKDFGW